MTKGQWKHLKHYLETKVDLRPSTSGDTLYFAYAVWEKKLQASHPDIGDVQGYKMLYNRVTHWIQMFAKNGNVPEDVRAVKF